MDKSKLSIASVKLVNGGMKGIEVEYLLPSTKGNVQFLDIYKSKRKAPIHTELEDCFKWLRNHMLDICGYSLDPEERSYLLPAIEMTGVKYGDKGIIMTANLNILGGNKVLSLTTPLIVDELDYKEYGDLVKIINGIYSETKDYMAGLKVMSDVQIVARFNAKNDDFDIDSFNKMTAKEQRDLATKILEDQGCMVFHNDELTDEPGQVIDTTKPVEFTKPVQYDFEEEIRVAVENKAPLIVEGSAELFEESKDVFEDDDFSLNITAQPVKVSTAKRKVK